MHRRAALPHAGGRRGALVPDHQPVLRTVGGGEPAAGGAGARACAKCWRPISSSRVAGARVDELLERFGLADKAGLAVAQLSHGEQRRLEVAVALACRPKVLLLDEPTQGMSHGDTEDTAALIRSLAADVTVLLIEHDIGLVMNLSDHVIVMHQGRKLAEGTPAAVRADPAVQTAYFGHA